MKLNVDYHDCLERLFSTFEFFNLSPSQTNLSNISITIGGVSGDSANRATSDTDQFRKNGKNEVICSQFRASKFEKWKMLFVIGFLLYDFIVKTESSETDAREIFRQLGIHQKMRQSQNFFDWII